MAKRSSRMGIGKHHAIMSQFIQIGRGDLRLIIICADVSVAHVINEDE